MAPFGKRRVLVLVCASVFLFFLYSFRRFDADALGTRVTRPLAGSQRGGSAPAAGPRDGTALGRQTRWSRLQTRHPVKNMRQLPTGQPKDLPRIQKTFDSESASEREVRLQRRDAVKKAFQRCWNSYRKYAFGSDELKPVTGGRHDPFGGWGATLVDSLDTLWIMGMKDEFSEAVAAASKIDFDKVAAKEVNVFETTIRYLGGFLAAYDLSGDKRLLAKACEVGEMLYVAFDTPNRMPVTRWDARAALWGKAQLAQEHTILSEIGTFSLEFTRLSILTGDPKWYDASQRIIELFQEQQQATQLPGMWPVIVDARKMDFRSHIDYSLGALADSLYEYLPKTHALVGGLLPMYREMYEASMDTAIRYNLFRPMLPDEKDVLISGHMMSKFDSDRSEYYRQLRPEGQHLTCFAGGMLALGGRLIQNETHVEKGEKLMDGCIWTYQGMPLGIMPERFYMLRCESADHCPWDADAWRKAVLKKAGLDEKMDAKQADEAITGKRIPKGFVSIDDERYVLRPEAIESVFILYRITGRKDLPDAAWKMWEAIDKTTKTRLANSAVWDITVTEGKPPMSDSMESFWLGETLKYFYLMFSEPELINLDEYVFNTEAHPFKRLLPE